ncbi:unnamed protein product [Closterium sp. NIES-53]
MALRPSYVPLQVPLPPPPASSLLAVPDTESDFARAANPTVPRLLATVVTDPLFESTAASALVSKLVDFAAACRLNYATSLEDFERLAAVVPHLVAMLLAPEGDPDAPDIPTPRSYAEAITRPYSSQWQTVMDTDMASWKSTGTYVDAVPPSRANVVDGMWIFMVKRSPGFPPVFKARYVARGFRQRQGAPREWHDTLRTTLAALGFAPSTADPSLFVRIDTSLPPFFFLVYLDDLVFATADTKALALVKSELQKRHTCTDLVHRGWGSCLEDGVQLSSLDTQARLGSTCEAGIYAGAMAAQELRWLTYLLTDLGEQPRCFLFVQLRLAYVATQANTADIFIKAVQSARFAFLDWSCDHLFSPTLPMEVCQNVLVLTFV